MLKKTLPALTVSLLLLGTLAFSRTSYAGATGPSSARAAPPARVVIFASSERSLRIAPAWRSRLTVYANGCWARTVRKKTRHGCLSLAKLRQVRRALRRASMKMTFHRIRCLAVATHSTSVTIPGKGSAGWSGPCGGYTPQASLVSAYRLVHRLAR